MTVKTVPVSGRLLRAIFPPMQSVASLQNGKPRPVSLLGSLSPDRRIEANFSNTRS